MHPYSRVNNAPGNTANLGKIIYLLHREVDDLPDQGHRYRIYGIKLVAVRRWLATQAERGADGDA